MALDTKAPRFIRLCNDLRQCWSDRKDDYLKGEQEKGGGEPTNEAAIDYCLDVIALVELPGYADSTAYLDRMGRNEYHELVEALRHTLHLDGTLKLPPYSKE